MKRLTIVALMLATLSSCATDSYRYVHESKNQSDYERDKYECGLVVQSITDRSPYRGNPLIIGPQAAEEFGNCMNFRYGWRRVSCAPGSPGCGLYWK